MNTKTSNCVGLQHRGGAKLQARLAKMAAEEEERFWGEVAETLRAEQEAARRGSRASIT